MAETRNVKQTVAISGAFSPLHVGHIRHIKAASKHGDVIIILNTDSWIRRRDGEITTPWNERAEILREIRGVKDVIMANDDDDTISKTLRLLYPTYFANGGHRKIENTPEAPMCIELGIALIWSCGK